MSNRQRLSARDYKHGGAREGRFDFMQYRQFGLGLAVGLAVALGVFIYDRRPVPEDVAAKAVPDKVEAPAGTDEAVAASEEPEEDFAFYDMLNEGEAMPPSTARGTQRNPAPLPVERPGLYVVQISSSRSRPDAEKLVERLAKLGVQATIQPPVMVEGVAWHRVQVGPLRDLAKINATRRALHGAGIDSMLTPMGD